MWFFYAMNGCMWQGNVLMTRVINVIYCCEHELRLGAFEVTQEAHFVLWNSFPVLETKLNYVFVSELVRKSQGISASSQIQGPDKRNPCADCYFFAVEKSCYFYPSMSRQLFPLITSSVRAVVNKSGLDIMPGTIALVVPAFSRVTRILKGKS